MDKFKRCVLIRDSGCIPDDELKDALAASIDKRGLKRVLIVPPDMTRQHSGGGKITNILYHMLKDSCEADILPALGTHAAMTQEECAAMFKDIPFSRFIAHNWRTDITGIGEAPRELVNDLSGGIIDEPVEFQINKRLLYGYDLILSVGQVVPHEVVGMASYTKNILVGCGGSKLINISHYLGAVCGMENAMGRDFSPVRKLFDYAERELLKDIPLCYVLTVTTVKEGNVNLHGIFVGRDRKLFEEAVRLSQYKNLTLTDTPFKKVVVYLDPSEFRSTWLGNKAIYRTRMAIADKGELVVLAPGVERFGEDDEIDRLIRKYGYKGTEYVKECCERYDELKHNLSAAAHLIHGSTEGRFSITYCPGRLTQEEITQAGFSYMPYKEAEKRYDIKKLRDGYNTLPDGERIFFISNPATGLWALSKIFKID